MKYSGYMIDLDGTVYRGRERIPEAKDFVERLQKAQIPFLFLTNNTTKSPAAVCKNLAENHDIHATPEQFIRQVWPRRLGSNKTAAATRMATQFM